VVTECNAIATIDTLFYLSIFTPVPVCWWTIIIIIIIIIKIINKKLTSLEELMYNKERKKYVGRKLKCFIVIVKTIFNAHKVKE